MVSFRSREYTMPHAMWRHSCCPAGTGSSNVPACSACGQPGAFDGWRLSMYEMMARYQYVFGVKPLGPHRGLTDQLLGPMRQQCANCAGAGICTLSVDAWRACPACEGTGGVWTGTPLQHDAAYAEILRNFPHAAARGRPRDFLAGAVVLDLANDEVITPASARSRSGDDQERAGSEAPPPAAETQHTSPSRWGALLGWLLGRAQGSTG